ncbi:MULTISPECIES: hypothetical protein [Candidatus Nitrosocaldus]|jgi:hypothetical protein|uniref:Uncharacterized protein n=1 Tax=Candidatus Nitrosocaldus cavascurensis TaxID=2058097 RepID=A0A2K5APU8_9ARCH|nr:MULTISPECIES: hypothetical protein [Candidatus Nitrosocaldus]GBC74044.1 hypothetical protein HRbin05_00075 [archaeon HR05]SPC33655.1 membrane protein of unknown function [Candidatus Nitrosocaldus cavascurensis]
MPIRKIDAIAIALLLVYFAVLPKIEQPFITTFFIFWITAYTLDAASTVLSRNITYETNRIFALFARMLGPLPALAVHFAIEVLFITFLPFVFLRMLSIEASAFIAMVTGMLHAYAALSNIMFRPSSSSSSTTNKSIYFGSYRLHTLYI